MHRAMARTQAGRATATNTSGRRMPPYGAPERSRSHADRRADRRISRGDCDQRSSRSATSLPERERTERRFGRAEASATCVRRAPGRLEHSGVMRDSARSTSSDRQSRSRRGTDRDGMPLGLHDPRAEGPADRGSAQPVSGRWRHEAAGQRATVNRAVARDKPGDVGDHPRDNGRHGGGRGRGCPLRARDPAGR